MYDILSLREDFEGLGSLVHDQCGICVQNLLGKDLDGILSLADHVLHPLYKHDSFLVVLHVLVRYEVRLTQHLLEYRVVFSRCRRVAHTEYLFMGGFIGNELVEHAETKEGDLVVRLFLNEADDHGPEKELDNPRLLLD